jgi:hypothetical protein
VCAAVKAIQRSEAGDQEHIDPFGTELVHSVLKYGPCVPALPVIFMCSYSTHVAHGDPASIEDHISHHYANMRYDLPISSDNSQMISIFPTEQGGEYTSHAGVVYKIDNIIHQLIQFLWH